MIQTDNFKIPESYLDKWQKTVDLMAEFFAVPVGLFMRVHKEEVEVLVASRTETNPYIANERIGLEAGTYCKKVVTSQSMLQVPNALKDPEWENNPGVELNLIAYMGVPVFWPNGNVFGTLCVMDRKERNWPENFNKLICQFKDLMEADLCILVTKINREYEEEIKELIEKLPLPVIIGKLNGEILKVNESFTSVFGFSLEDIPSKEAWLERMFSEDRNKEEVLIAWTKDINSVIKKDAQIPVRTYKLSCKDSDVKDAEVSVRIFKEWVLLTLNDITEKIEYQKEIWNSVIQAEEKERGRIARDLHDGLGPLLSAIKINTQWLSNPDKVTNEEYITGELNRTIDEAIVSIKEISNNLSPHLLSNHGLVPAIESFIDKLEQASTISFLFQTDLNERLNKNCEIAIYRIFTECLNNAIKYAKADTIDIKLHKEKEMIKMHIADDGIGFDVKDAFNKKNSNGLINITNRIRTIGGNIDIKSKKGKGTKIVIQIVNE